MKWRRTRPRAAQVLDREPLVLSVTEPVTRDTAPSLVARLVRISANHHVVIDLTGIPAFDSEGTAALVGLQESMGPDRLTIVGLRQATARLVGSGEVTPPAAPEQFSPWVVRRLRAIAVVQTADQRPATMEGMEAAILAAIDEAVGIVVVDLRGARLSRHGVQAIAFASSTAALRGQELLVVNVDADAGERLRRAGLSATTYVAPEPLGEF